MISEKFVLIHRLVLFLDEWGFYTVLLLLLFASYFLSWVFLIPLVLVAIYGGMAIWVSYNRQWKFEKLLLKEDNNDRQT